MMKKSLLTAAFLLSGMAAVQAQSTDDWTVGEDISQFLEWGDYDGSSNDGGYWQGSGATYSANEWEIFQGSDVDRYQMVYLPAGVYRFRCQGFYRDGGNGQAADNYFAGKSSTNAVLYAETGAENEEGVFVATKTFSTPFMSQWATGNTEHLYETTEWTNDASYTYDEVEYWAPNCMDGTRVYFDHGFYDDNVVQFYLMEDGFVKLGLRKPGVNIGSDWLIFTNFRIIFQGDANEGVELLALQEEVAGYYNKIVEIENSYSGGLVYTLISDAMMEFDAQYGDIESMDKAQCEAALATITEFYDSVLSLTESYAKLDNVVAQMEILYNSTDYPGKAAFGQVLEATKVYVDPNYEIQDSDDLNTFTKVLNEILAARITYLMTQEKVNGAYNFSSSINNPFFCDNQYTPVWNAEANAYQFPNIEGVEDDLQPENTWATIQEQDYSGVKNEHSDWIPIADGVKLADKPTENQWYIKSTTWHGGGSIGVTMQHSYPAIGGWTAEPTGNPELLYQTVTGLPNGYYAMSALMCNAGAEVSPLQFAYIETEDAKETAPLTKRGNPWWGGNREAWRSGVWEKLTTNMVYVGDGKVTIGTSSDTFYAATGFQLYFYGENPDFTALVAPALEAAKANVENLAWPGDRAAVLAILEQVPATIDGQEAYRAALTTIAEANAYVSTATSVINNWKGIDNFGALAEQQPEGSAEANIVNTAWMYTLGLGEGETDTYLDAIESDKDYAAYVSYLDYRTSMGDLISNEAVAAVVAEQNAYLTENYANAAKLAELKAALAAPYNKALLASLGMDKASAENPVDVTALIVNPKFDELSKGWDGEMTVDSLGTAERWNCNFRISQTIYALPAGCYQVKAQALYRDASDANAAYNNWWYVAGTEMEFWDNPNAKLFANANEESIISIASEIFTDQSHTAYVNGWQKAEEGDEQGNDVWEPVWVYQSDAEEGKENDYPWDTMVDDLGEIYYYPASLRGVSCRFAKNPEAYINSVATVIEEGGSLTFGLKKDTLISGDWCAFDNFQLFYLGQDVPTAILTPDATVQGGVEYYSVSGARLSGPQRGINIVKTNGQVKKVFIK